MSRFVRDHLFAESFGDRTHVLLQLLCRSKKGVTGEENKPRPALAKHSWHLRNGEAAVGIRPKKTAEELQGPGGRICHSLCVPRGRRWRRRQYRHGHGVQSAGWKTSWIDFNLVFGEGAFHGGCGIGFHRDAT